MTALRITYAIAGGTVRITAARPVDARVAPPVPDRTLDAGTGTWIEVRDAEDRRIWARVLDEHTFAGTLRMQAGDGIGTMTRVPVDRVTDTVLVPAAEGGRVLIRSQASGEGEAATLAEVPVTARR